MLVSRNTCSFSHLSLEIAGITNISSTSWVIRIEVFEILSAFFFRLPDNCCGTALDTEFMNSWEEYREEGSIYSRKIIVIVKNLCLTSAYISLRRPMSHDLSSASRNTITCLYFFVCFVLFWAEHTEICNKIMNVREKSRMNCRQAVSHICLRHLKSMGYIINSA